MTVSYSDHFWKLFFRWKGSLWKTIWKDLIVFLILYSAISAIYRCLLDDQQRVTFERLVVSFDDYTKNIPLTFMLGFYVGMVVKRWWEQFQRVSWPDKLLYWVSACIPVSSDDYTKNIPLTFMLGFYVGMVVKRWWEQFQRVSWPDKLLYWVSACIPGDNIEARQIRRTIARHTILGAVLGWRSISVRVLKRFPTLDHLVNVGLLTIEEKGLLETVRVRYDPHKHWFVPLNWVLSTLVRAHQSGRISHVNEFLQVSRELEAFRMGFMELYIYDWITIPLVYSQVAVVATYGYFGLCLIGRQYIHPLQFDHLKGVVNHVDIYVPIFTILQFFFFVGWLKVGEDLMNPFGEDDEDFEFNYLIDRHLEMSYLIVDDLHGSCPTQLKDTGLSAESADLPHTVASHRCGNKAPHSHVRNICLKSEEMQVLDHISPPVSQGWDEPYDDKMLQQYLEDQRQVQGPKSRWKPHRHQKLTGDTPSPEVNYANNGEVSKRRSSKGGLQRKLFDRALRRRSTSADRDSIKKLAALTPNQEQSEDEATDSEQTVTFQLQPATGETVYNSSSILIAGTVENKLVGVRQPSRSLDYNNEDHSPLENERLIDMNGTDSKPRGENV